MAQCCMHATECVCVCVCVQGRRKHSKLGTAEHYGNLAQLRTSAMADIIHRSGVNI